MSDDTITPDRLRMAGWDDNGRVELLMVFTHDGAPDARVAFCDWCQCWHWRTAHNQRLADPTGMADIAARLAAAEAGTAS